MKTRMIATFLLACGAALACTPSPHGDAAATTAPSGADAEITAFIGKIRAVDNHSHANSVAPGDSDQDALPLEVIFPFEVPVPLRPDNPDWLAAYKALYKYPHADMSDAHMTELRGAMQRVAKEQGDKFPEWVLDRIGTEVMLANRVAMGPGLAPPRFRWVSYVDALMLPLSTKAEAAASPDRQKLYPPEEKLLKRYLADLHVERLPATLDAYLKTVVNPTLERQRQTGCVAVKFEAALLRALDFDEVPAETASRVYSRYAAAGEPSHADYKALQDFLFRHIAREAGRLGMAVHLHSFNGPGNFFRAAGADPLLLESAFNDPSLRQTNFVIVHGGGVYAPHAGAMLWKPNVYLDMSAMTLLYTPAKLAEVLRDWLTQYPEKVLFGSDAAALGPDTGWELAAWIATKNGRAALALAPTDMIRNGEVSRARAEEIATMVTRTNAATLYHLGMN
jgi:predicted TIM-barrel fold metal-dependent hydrolase